MQMILIERILGDRHDTAFANHLHRLEHDNAVDVIVVSPADMARHRLRATTERGADVAIALPRTQSLFDGAVLMLETHRAIVVRSAAERWLRLRPSTREDALELGYQAGNLHWRVRFSDGDLLVALSGPAASYIERVARLIKAGRIAILAEGA
jgi:urease accessory protein